MNKKIINNIKDKILKKEGEKNNIKLYEGFFN